MKDFGKIKFCFNNLFMQSVVSKNGNGKKLFKKYLKAIKENEILRTQFLVYNNIENRVDTDFNSAAIFLSENLSLFNKFKPSDITKANTDLAKLLPQIDGITEGVNDGIKILYESLETLILTKPSPYNVNKLTDAKKSVIGFINGNTNREIMEGYGVKNEVLSKFLFEKFVEKYSQDGVLDINILNTLVESDFSKKEAAYKTMSNECIIIIDNLLRETTDDTTQKKLILVKDKLLKDSCLNESQFFDKYKNLIELKNNLTN